ncbi:DUF1707 domain-containing protein [Mycobacterium sp. AT1]|uniref:DUF1707 SHOCT-like domain-containing protein n=1 Tax=Mycobacterium sp. AT1 TaxID=1961706 RepID=UPI0009ACF6AE|nr:DUF1707 domain-containing protein [Mycobacterium sp. AT1]OPX11853.1 hypothetical protein B1790_06500 [Mycobacterium sp. AT1]
MATRQTAGTRAKDSDRNNTCQVLDSALADGQLSGEEHRIRVAAATTAATLGDLQQLVEDLQNDNAPVQMPDLKKPSRLASGGGSGWGMRVAVAGVLVVLGIAIGWGLYGNTTSPLSFTSDPGAKSDGIPAKVLTPPRQLMSLGGLNGLFEQMRQKFGDTKGFELTIFDDYASLERQDPAEPRRVLRYSYRGGWADPSETNVSSDARVVDLGAVDVPTLVGLIRGAPGTLEMNPNEVKDMHVSISHDDDVDAAPEALSIQIFVSPNFGNSGYFEVDGAGNIKTVHRPSR